MFLLFQQELEAKLAMATSNNDIRARDEIRAKPKMARRSSDALLGFGVKLWESHKPRANLPWIQGRLRFTGIARASI